MAFCLFILFHFYIIVFFSITDQLCRIMARYAVIDCGNLHFDRILQRKSWIYVLSKADMHYLYRIAQPRTGIIFVSPREVRSRSPLLAHLNGTPHRGRLAGVLRGKGGLRFFYCYRVLSPHSLLLPPVLPLPPSVLHPQPTPSSFPNPILNTPILPPSSSPSSFPTSSLTSHLTSIPNPLPNPLIVPPSSVPYPLSYPLLNPFPYPAPTKGHGLPIPSETKDVGTLAPEGKLGPFRPSS